MNYIISAISLPLMTMINNNVIVPKMEPVYRDLEYIHIFKLSPDSKEFKCLHRRGKNLLRMMEAYNDNKLTRSRDLTKFKEMLKSVDDLVEKR